MTYRIDGLDPTLFDDLRSLDDGALAARGARRVVATAKPGFPCRVTLDDAAPGDVMILLHHVSHDVATPYRSAYAIYIREAAAVAATYRDAVPPALAGRPLGLRGFAVDGMLAAARLSLPGQADADIRALFDDPAIVYIDAHNAAHGCFVARVERA